VTLSTRERLGLGALATVSAALVIGGPDLPDGLAPLERSAPIVVGQRSVEPVRPAPAVSTHLDSDGWSW
jgi:hypothetical protein